MNIISWNVNGLRANVKKGAFDWFLQKSPDFMCYQETKVHPEQLDEGIRNPIGYNAYFDHSKLRKGYSGVAIYAKEKPEKVEYGLGVSEYDQEGRFLAVFYNKGLIGTKFVLINCYFPNGGGAPERLRYKLDFYDYFLEFINKLHKKQLNIIFCGDLNVAHKPIDLARPKENETHVGFLPIERAWVDKVISHGWVDVFRHFYPNQTEIYTYWDMKTFARERNVGWRIDYFFSSLEILGKIKSVEILDNIFGSDHCPIKLVLK